MDNLTQQVESLIFSTEHPISLDEIKDCLEMTFESEVSMDDIRASIEGIRLQYSEDRFSFELVEIGGGYQFLSKGAYFNTIGNYLKLTTRKQLSRAALETLAIVAYKQPVSKSELEKIRGVNCDYSVQKLLEKELVTILGRSDGPGRPLLYGTSEKFMDYFGINSIEDLPKPKDFKLPDSEVGEAAPMEQEIPAENLLDEEE
jgi:segregation and condensation protein B